MKVHNEMVSAPPQARNAPSRLKRALVKGVVALGLMAIGAAGAVLVLRFGSHTPAGLSPLASPPAATGTGAGQAAVAPAGDPEVVLSLEAMAQVGIKTAQVTVVEPHVTIQLPGSVMADAYREVKVTPIVGGIVTKVHIDLGTVVKRGASLATVFSAELAEVQTKYLSMRAMLEADHQKLQRTRQLVEIGAASRQELEEVTAVHESHATEVAAARQRLLLLGLNRTHVEALNSPGQVVSEVIIPAPIAGVITSRAANLGQVVSMEQELFVVTDLSRLWVIGDLYEQDFQAVQVGSDATITTPAYPDMTLRGRVSYIDPRVEPQTRTAKIRVEVPNPQGRLRLGMYVTMAFTTRRRERAVVVPRTAIQTLGERHVVFVATADEEGKFVRRTVQVGSLHGDFYTILDGLAPGEIVVTEGNFFLRAESLRNAPSG
jgi:RND family efflux transporter MFP subunit